MLRFFEKYQKGFFFFIAILMIASFSFFGTFETFLHSEERREDRKIGEKIDHSPMMRSEVERIVRVLLCDEEVIRTDFLQTGIADRLVSSYFEPLKEDLQLRLERAKRFRPYAHPQVPYLSTTLVWTRIFPDMLQEFQALREEEEVTTQTFTHLSHLYQQQRAFPPEFLRQYLIAQQQQQGIQPDLRLAQEDLALFRFHSVEDWFGRRFLELAAQLILNGAVIAEKKGFQVSLEEAKGDLLLKRAHFGLDEKNASEAWRQILLFRRYFRGLGDAVLLDGLAYREFASYALEAAEIDRYTWPVKLRDFQDLLEFEAYLQAISSDREGLPKAFYSLDEVEKKFPELVQETYRAQVAEIPKSQVLLRASVKEVWDWEFAHWDLLRKKFPILPEASSRQERFAALESLDPKQCGEIDRFARNALLESHPEWVDAALAAQPLQERTFSTPLQSEEVFYRIEEMEQIAPRHLVTFEEAQKQGLLTPLAERLFPEKSSQREALRQKDLYHRFLKPSQEAYAALQLDALDSRWIKVEGEDPIGAQFKLEKTQEEVWRMGKEQSIFSMEERQWSTLEISEQGVSFFFLSKKRSPYEPILSQIEFGKAVLSADVQATLAEPLIEASRNTVSLDSP